MYYKEYYDRFETNLLQIQTEQELTDSEKWRENFNRICLVGDNLGILAFKVDRRFDLMRMASDRIEEGKEVQMAAVVCKVNKLRYPDECYAKVQQMKNITVKPR